MMVALVLSPTSSIHGPAHGFEAATPRASTQSYQGAIPSSQPLLFQVGVLRFLNYVFQVISYCGRTHALTQSTRV